MTVPAPESAPSVPELKTLGSLIGRLAHAMERALPTGDVAALRRMPSGLPNTPAFWKVAALYLEGHLPEGDRDEAERRWATILHSMAVLRGFHQPGRRLGAVLAELRFSEMRFLKLLRSHGDRLVDELRAMTHYLASKGAAVDVTDIARLVLSVGRQDDDAIRRRTARDFFANVNRQD